MYGWGGSEGIGCTVLSVVAKGWFRLYQFSIQGENIAHAIGFSFLIFSRGASLIRCQYFREKWQYAKFHTWNDTIKVAAIKRLELV